MGHLSAGSSRSSAATNSRTASLSSSLELLRPVRRSSKEQASPGVQLRRSASLEALGPPTRGMRISASLEGLPAARHVTSRNRFASPPRRHFYEPGSPAEGRSPAAMMNGQI